ncbi:MAG: FAD-binding oxidoreductase [Bacteroidota bacterium]
MKVDNWGSYPSVDGQHITPPSVEEMQELLRSRTHLIPRGNGRCYGDSALAASMISTRHLNAILDFDTERGIITAETGLLFDDLLQYIVPYGWFLPVVPGTKMITLGGAIASNVHGKNHHQAGAFGDYILSFKLIDEAGVLKSCSRKENPILFAHTIGGYGTTGIIVSIKLQLQRITTSYYHQQSFHASSLRGMLQLFEAHRDSPYLVAWLDGLYSTDKLGSGILHTGRNCELVDLPSPFQPAPLLLHRPPRIKIPKLPTGWLMNKLSLRLNNALYHWQHRRGEQSKVVHYSQFFFPLDALQNWKHLYGPAGLLQYQFVVPQKNAEACITEVLRNIRQAHITPYLIVLKTMGARSTAAATTDFPMPGYSLAIDFKQTPSTRAFLDLLDQIIIAYQGRVYLTKDARLPAASFRQMYPEAQQIPGRFRSLQSIRIYDL